jgi:hypothetical protein
MHDVSSSSAGRHQQHFYLGFSAMWWWEVLCVAASICSPCHQLVKMVGSMLLQAAACLGVLGPRTVFTVAINGYPGTHEFLLQDDGKFIHVKETTEMSKCGTPGMLGGTVLPWLFNVTEPAVFLPRLLPWLVASPITMAPTSKPTQCGFL